MFDTETIMVEKYLMHRGYSVPFMQVLIAIILDME